MIPADLLEMLRCPQTRQMLTLAEPALLAKIQTLAKTTGTNAVESGILDAALVRADRLVAYPVLNGIPVLLAEQVITL